MEDPEMKKEEIARHLDAADDDPRDAAETRSQACVSMMFDGGDDDE
jgi:hypothetical protein